jgi:hypothetical protein
MLHAQGLRWFRDGWALWIFQALHGAAAIVRAAGKISTVKWIQYIIYCRFEIIAVDMITVLEKPAGQA